MRELHLTDSEILLDLDGEAPAQQSAQVRAHLESCWRCRTRRSELEAAIAGYVREVHRPLDAQIPTAAGPRALLRARMQAAPPVRRRWFWLAASAAACLLAALLLPRPQAEPAGPSPDPAYTPGAAQTVASAHLCVAIDGTDSPQITPAMAREVFRRYGIRNPQPRSYEVDYLIPPSLGGTAALDNLWPQPYETGVWNARVKDALEDRLRDLVCRGQLDLSTAQRDLAHDWIAAYRKYFRTSEPLVQHAAFVEDGPRE